MSETGARLRDRLQQAASGPAFPEETVRQLARPGRKNLSALLVAALNVPVYVTIDCKRRNITKREAIVTQMVNKSAKADLRATKMLFDMMKEVEQQAGDALHAFIAGLGMPRSLGAVKIGPESFERIAEGTMDTPWLPRNPRHIDGPAPGPRDRRTRGLMRAT